MWIFGKKKSADFTTAAAVPEGLKAWEGERKTFFAAIENFDPQVLRGTIEKDKNALYWKDSRGLTALQIALKEKRLDSFRELLELGAEASFYLFDKIVRDKRSDFAYTALQYTPTGRIGNPQDLIRRAGNKGQYDIADMIRQHGKIRDAFYEERRAAAQTAAAPPAPAPAPLTPPEAQPAPAPAKPRLKALKTVKFEPKTPKTGA